MKLSKKLLGFVASFVFILSLSIAIPMAANAEEYTYTIKVVLGGSGDEGAYFNTDLGLSVPDDAQVELTDVNEETNTPQTLIIKNLKYNDNVTLDPSQMVGLTPQTKLDDQGNEVSYQKYYIKGIRIAGMNTVLHAQSFQVEYDETFVVAYGVGEVVPYIVNYVDQDGKALADSLTGYAPAGEELYVPYRYIAGYQPNTYNYHTKSLKAPVDDKPFEFTFKYTKGGTTSVVENTTEVTESSVVVGDKEYSYQAVRRSSSHSTETTTTGNNGRNTNNANGNNNGEDANAGDDANANAADDSTTIEDEGVPQDIIDIDDEEVAKAGSERDRFIRNMIVAIIIAIISIIVVLVAMYKANQSKKTVTVEKTDSKKNK